MYFDSIHGEGLTTGVCFTIKNQTLSYLIGMISIPAYSLGVQNAVHTSNSTFMIANGDALMFPASH